MFSKKCDKPFLSDSSNSINARGVKQLSICESPIHNARLVIQEIDYIVININVHRVYPTIIINQTPNSNNTIIDIE